ncbi:Eukaryotic translation initiation factor 4 gamma 3, partial [Pseudolycoriella hygida]
KLKNYFAALLDCPLEREHKEVPKESVNMEDVQRHIKNLLMENVKLDDIYNYISANVTEIDNNFIRALTSAVVDSSLDNRCKLNEKQFSQRMPLLERYIDGNGQLQVQCLNAIQILVNGLEHPPGLMQSIFSSLVTEKIISSDSIMKWKNQCDVMEGKDSSEEEEDN